jgi:putative Mg2+ transporter-C (MgtC) family protein
MITINDILFSNIIKLPIAILIGYLLGKERKNRDKSAGSRTMALVCFGSCLITIISLELNSLNYSFDFVRLMSYALPAISFIGAGVIQKQKNTIDGITTSAMLFAVVPLGFTIGLGYLSYSVIGALLIYLTLESKYWSNNGRNKNKKSRR